MPPLTSWTRRSAGREQDETEPLVQQPVHGAERERPDHEMGEPGVVGDPSRDVGTQAMRKQESDRLLAEPPPGERHDLRGRGVEPLDVVHGDQHRACPCELPEHAEHGHCDRPLVSRSAARWRKQECDPECIRLRLRQLVEHLVDHASDQVAETRERQPGLGLHRPCLEHAVAALARFFHAGEPERRLARSGLPLDHEPAWPGEQRVEESRRPRELGVSPDHFGGAHVRRPSTLAPQIISTK